MAKEFKNWDKVFSKEEIAECRKKYIHPTEALEWVKDYKQPNADEVRWAVYEGPGHREWQLFRVSLKGLSTSDKLYGLKRYFDSIMHNLQRTEEEQQLCVIRVNNYVGALRRGGLLNADFEIVK